MNVRKNLPDRELEPFTVGGRGWYILVHNLRDRRKLLRRCRATFIRATFTMANYIKEEHKW